MSRELSKYEIRPSSRLRKPAEGCWLSNMVAVRDSRGEWGYCYIKFAPAFLEKVGKTLPRGVSAHDPAGVRLVFYPHTGVWLIQAIYLKDPETQYLLWKTRNRPLWYNFHTRALKHGNSTRNPALG